MPAMHNSFFLIDRKSAEKALILMASHGDDAGLEAASKAEDCRDNQNVFGFCEWRQIERMIVAFADDADGHSIH